MHRLRVVVIVAMGVGLAACGARIAANRRGGESANRRNDVAATLAATAPTPAPATTKPEAVVDVNKPWMQWGDPRADAGRERPQQDDTASWSSAAALQATIPGQNAATPATQESIPKAVAPGSRVDAGPPVPEPADLLRK